MRKLRKPTGEIIRIIDGVVYRKIPKKSSTKRKKLPPVAIGQMTYELKKGKLKTKHSWTKLPPALLSPKLEVANTAQLRNILTRSGLNKADTSKFIKTLKKAIKTLNASGDVLTAVYLPLDKPSDGRETIDRKRGSKMSKPASRKAKS